MNGAGAQEIAPMQDNALRRVSQFAETGNLGQKHLVTNYFDRVRPNMTEMKPLLLLVDDDVRFRSLLETYLQRENFAVATAGNARQMYKVLGELPVDLIVLDIGLPQT